MSEIEGMIYKGEGNINSMWDKCHVLIAKKWQLLRNSKWQLIYLCDLCITVCLNYTNYVINLYVSVKTAQKLLGHKN